MCPVKVPDMNVPHYVSIVSRLRAPPGNLLEVRNTDWDKDFPHIRGANAVPSIPTENQIPDKIGVCVKPIHFNYDSALYLIEYLEFNAILGISHFTFYNHTLGEHAECVLKHYMSGDIPDNLTAWDEDLRKFENNITC